MHSIYIYKYKAQISDNLRKVRTTARFLLGNLYDFNHDASVDYHQLQEVKHLI
jgi:isoleucyl-tRNA synthetase